MSAFLNYVNDTVISNGDCADFYDSLITVTKICTASTGGKSPCDVSFSSKYCSEVHFLPSLTHDMPSQLQRPSQC